MGWIVSVAWQGRIPKIFIIPQDSPIAAKVAETEHEEKCGHIFAAVPFPIHDAHPPPKD